MPRSGGDQSKFQRIIALVPTGIAKSLCLRKWQRLFFLKGGEEPLAISKQRKEELQAQYADWLERSEAVILVEYTGASMKSIDAIRGKIRDAGGEFHIVKNTLARRVFAEKGMDVPADYLLKSTAISFAFTDPASTAKALTDATKGSEFVKVKGGLMGGKTLSAADVKALSDLPPLPVMRATLLGVLQAPAGKLVRTIAEPARGLAAVIQARSEAAQAAA